MDYKFKHYRNSDTSDLKNIEEIFFQSQFVIVSIYFSAHKTAPGIGHLAPASRRIPIPSMCLILEFRMKEAVNQSTGC